MNWSTEGKISTSFSFALLVLALVSILACWSTFRLINTARWVEHTQTVLRELELLLAELATAEAGQRGFIITGNEQHLDAYYLAITDIHNRVKGISQLTSDNVSQQQRIKALQPVITQRVTQLQDVLIVRREKGFAAAQNLIEQDIGRKLSKEIRSSIDSMLDEENRLLEIRSQQSRVIARNTVLVVGISGILAFGLIPFAGAVISRDVTRRRETEKTLQASEQQLKQWISELEQRNNEIIKLSRLSDALQACFTLDEAYIALKELLPPLFPDTDGGLFMINESKTLLEPVACWGPTAATKILFTPTECWSLRRGRPYFLEKVSQGLKCQHLKLPFPSQTFCIPMMAQGEALGVLYLGIQDTNPFTQTKQLLAITIAEQISVAIANLKLRETLKNQSIRDPLTGLFNRRYMEESLERELRRADRNRQSLGVIMLDVDHFKRFNDTFGHEAGDLVLREVGQLLKGTIRGSDIACRYGGEEFILILPDTSVEDVQQKAEQVRIAVKKLNLKYRHQPLDAITVSLGIASFPQHGTTVEVITRIADTALYQAKHQGRDQAVIAQ